MRTGEVGPRRNRIAVAKRPVDINLDTLDAIDQWRGEIPRWRAIDILIETALKMKGGDDATPVT